MAVNTPIGKITAYNVKALGVQSESNSLKFSEDGMAESVVPMVDINI